MRRVLIQVALLIALLVSVGCGGGGGTSGTSRKQGSMTVRIVWPPLARTIPANTSKVTLTLDGPTQLSKDIDRPTAVSSTNTSTTTLTIGGLLPGDYTVGAASYAAGDATNALSNGQAPLSIIAGKDTTFDILMASTVDHYLVTDLGANGNSTGLKAFSPAAFYMDDNGAYAYSGGVKSYLTSPPAYNVTQASTVVMVTPQAATQIGTSGLALLPANTSSTTANIQLTTNGGLVASSYTSGSPAKVVPYSYSIVYTTSAATSGVLTLNYSDYTYDAMGNATLGSLKSFSTNVGLQPSSVGGGNVVVNAAGSATSTGLPGRFSTYPNGYRLTATLNENPAGEDPGSSYAGTLDTANPKKINFGFVTDRHRGFTADVTLQVKTEDGGFVDLARWKKIQVAASNLGSSAADGTPLDLPLASDSGSGLSVSLPTVTVPTQPSVLFKRGGQAILTGVKTQIALDASTVTALLDLRLFSFSQSIGGILATSPALPAPPTPLSVESLKISALDSTTTDTSATGEIDATFVGGYAPPDLGKVPVTVTPNGGHVGVGVN